MSNMQKSGLCPLGTSSTAGGTKFNQRIKSVNLGQVDKPGTCVLLFFEDASRLHAPGELCVPPEATIGAIGVPPWSLANVRTAPLLLCVVVPWPLLLLAEVLMPMTDSSCCESNSTVPSVALLPSPRVSICNTERLGR